jgi:hypothetical protein
MRLLFGIAINPGTGRQAGKPSEASSPFLSSVTRQRISIEFNNGMFYPKSSQREGEES